MVFPTMTLRHFLLLFAGIFGLIGVQPQASAQYYPPAGSGGDHSELDNCDPPDVLVGFRYRAGSWLDQIQIGCARLNDDYSVGPVRYNVRTTRGGNGGGGPLSKECPAGKIIVGIEFIMTEGNKEVRYVKLNCARADGKDPEAIGFGGGNTSFGTAWPKQPCDPGKGAFGVKINFGKYVNALGLYCRFLPKKNLQAGEDAKLVAFDLQVTGKNLQQCAQSFQRCNARCNPQPILLRPQCSAQCSAIMGGCQAGAAALEASKGGGSAGGAPPEWSDMLAAHNELRKQHCVAPLTWSPTLAKASQEYAEKCNLGQHGSSGENLSTAAFFNIDNNGVKTPVLPATSDRTAFKNTWACESEFYKYDDPKICPGFKGACNEPKAECGGNPVTGHFTQVVWKDTTQLGCGRATCSMEITDDKTGEKSFVKGTNWVCRYGPAGNINDPNILKEQVRDPATCVNGIAKVAEDETNPNRRAGNAELAGSWAMKSGPNLKSPFIVTLRVDGDNISGDFFNAADPKFNGTLQGTADQGRAKFTYTQPLINGSGKGEFSSRYNSTISGRYQPEGAKQPIYWPGTRTTAATPPPAQPTPSTESAPSSEPAPTTETVPSEPDGKTATAVVATDVYPKNDGKSESICAMDVGDKGKFLGTKSDDERWIHLSEISGGCGGKDGWVWKGDKGEDVDIQ